MAGVAVEEDEEEEDPDPDAGVFAAAAAVAGCGRLIFYLGDHKMCRNWCRRTDARSQKDGVKSDHTQVVGQAKALFGGPSASMPKKQPSCSYRS